MKISTVLLLLGLLLSDWQECLAEEVFVSEQKDGIIAELSTALAEKYVLADEGAKFSKQLLEKHQQGTFNDAKSKAEFVAQVNQSLYAITRDKHINVRPQQTSAQPGRVMRRVAQPGADNNAAPADGQKRMVRRVAPSNSGEGAGNQSMKAMFGLPEGESLLPSILPGNIGLMTVKDLMGSVEEVNQVMEKLADTDGLVIDVRQCPGGSGMISTQIASYFSPEGSELMRYYTRGEPVVTTRSVQLPSGSKRYLNKPVYLVTSEFTGSACEALSYVLKYHDLARVLGEKSAGAGHALTAPMTSLGQGLVAFIPNTRPEHPNHKGGFEKVGVAVDIDASSPIAVDRAHQLVLSELMSKGDNKGALATTLLASINATNSQLLAQANSRREQQELLGEYGDNDALIFERGQLKLQLASGVKVPLKQLKKDLFQIVSIRTDQKVRIDRNAKGEVKGISISPGKGQTVWKEKLRS